MPGGLGSFVNYSNINEKVHSIFTDVESDITVADVENVYTFCIINIQYMRIFYVDKPNNHMYILYDNTGHGVVNYQFRTTAGVVNQMTLNKPHIKIYSCPSLRPECWFDDFYNCIMNRCRRQGKN
jgi:hypothetical protein